MALAKKQSRSSSIIVIAIVVLILGVIGYFVYNRFILSAANNGNNPGAIGNRAGLVNYNPVILNDSRVKNLQDYRRTTNIDVNSSGQVEPFR